MKQMKRFAALLLIIVFGISIFAGKGKKKKAN